MDWKIVFDKEFDPEFEALSPQVQDELYAQTKWLEPKPVVPGLTHLKDLSFPIMKELRFNAADGVSRVAFAFDPKRKAILLVAGDKSGLSEKKFYRNLIEKADSRYKRHLTNLKDPETGQIRKGN